MDNMSENTLYTGDSLLQVYKELNIDLGNLSPNVVRGWFDTEDPDVLNLLTFMCSSLSKENLLTPQELQEYEDLENPIFDSELESAAKTLEDEIPSVFNYELNSQQLRIASEEMELLKQEEQRLDNLIAMSERLQQNLLHKKSDLEREHAALDFKCVTVEEECEELCKVFDNRHMLLYEKLIQDLSQLSSFQFDDNTEFLNRMNLEEIQDSPEFYTSIQDIVRKQHADLSGNFSESKINLNSTPNDETLRDNLEIFKSQIFSSYMKYIEVKIEEESMLEVLNYLENFFAKDYLMSCSNSSISETVLGSKVGQKEVLFSLLEKKAMNISEEPINCIKIKKAQKELKNIESNLVCFSQISKYYSKVLCITSCALMLILQEKKCIEDSEKFIRYMSRYILDTLNVSKDRAEVMLNFLEKFDSFKLRPQEYRNEVMSSVMKLYSGNILNDAFISCDQIRRNLSILEKDYFVSNSTELSEIVEKLSKNDIRIFLNSGPTSRIVVIPNEIQKSLKNIRLNLDKQTSAIKFLLQITMRSLKELSSDAFLKNYRLCWVYFLVAPKKLQELLDQLSNELKAKETRSVRFKD